MEGCAVLTMPMVRESFAILLVGVLLLAVFLRSHHPGYLVGSLPVFFIPAAHVLICILLYFTKGAFFGLRAAVVMAFVDVLALAASCVFEAIFSMRIESKRNRKFYLIIMLVYSVLLGWSYLYTTLKNVLI